MSLATSLSVRIDAKNQIIRDLSTSNDPIVQAISKTVADGTGANQANRVFADKRELAASGSETINLNNFAVDAGAAAVDNLGQAYNLSKVALICIYVSSGSVTVGNEGSADEWNSWAGGTDAQSFTLAAGGVWLLFSPAAAGYAVATGNKLLKIANASGAVVADYEIIVIGG